MPRENQIRLLEEISKQRVNPNTYRYKHQLINEEKTWSINRNLFFVNLTLVMIEISCILGLYKLLIQKQQNKAYIVLAFLLSIVVWFLESKFLKSYVTLYFDKFQLIQTKAQIIQSYQNLQLNDTYISLSIQRSIYHPQQNSHTYTYSDNKKIRLKALDSVLQTASFRNLSQDDMFDKLIVCQNEIQFAFVNDEDAEKLNRIIEVYKRNHQAKIKGSSKITISYEINEKDNGLKYYCTDKSKIQSLRRVGYYMSYCLLLFPFMIAVQFFMVRKFKKRIMKNVRVD